MPTGEMSERYCRIIFQVCIYFEECSYKSPRVDVWEISDLNLFKESVGVTKKGH